MNSGYHEKELVETVKKNLRFIVLVPHRDSGRILEEYRRSLFAAGIDGAYSFPAAAPLARVSRPFTAEELKACARALRELSLQNGGKISAAGLGAGDWGPGRSHFLGLLLDLPWDDNAFAGNRKVLFRFPKPLLCACLLGDESPVQTDKIEGNPRFPQAPQLSFRAAMVANLSLRPLETGAAHPASDTGPFEWKLSAPAWLPKLHLHSPPQ